MTRGLHHCFSLLIFLGLCLASHSAFAETDWSNYDWASEEEVLGPDLNPRFVAVDTEGVEKCRDSVFMINHELWNGLCGDLKRYARRSFADSLPQGIPASVVGDTMNMTGAATMALRVIMR